MLLTSGYDSLISAGIVCNFQKMCIYINVPLLENKPSYGTISVAKRLLKKSFLFIAIILKDIISLLEGSSCLFLPCTIEFHFAADIVLPKSNFRDKVHL